MADGIKVAVIDADCIAITKTTSQTQTSTHTRASLLAQQAAIQAQKDRDNIQRDAELAEVAKLLSFLPPGVAVTQPEMVASAPVSLES